MSSKSEELQNKILRIAARSDKGLDLSNKTKKKLFSIDCLQEAVSKNENILYAGVENPSYVESVADWSKDGGRLIVTEPEEALLNQVEKDNYQLQQTELDDLQTSPSALADYLSEKPVRNFQEYQQMQEEIRKQCSENPVIADDSLDLAIFDLAINRLSAERVPTALDEAFRVLRRGGRLYLMVLLADEKAPEDLPSVDEEIALSYIPEEKEIIDLLHEAGFYGMNYTWRADLPFKIVDGVELRPFIVEAHKGKQGICLDQGHAVIYQGPWREIYDDDHHRFIRGERTAVCEKTYNLLKREPYKGHFIYIPPYLEVPLDQAPLFDCNTPQVRDPAVTKARKTVFDAASSSSGDCCSSDDDDCCSSDDDGCCS